MTRPKKNKIRGLLLLLVFSLNTVAGFACSIGVDMGYNSSHHQQDEFHSAQKADTHSERHHHDHSSTPSDEKKEPRDTKNEDDCCTNGITDFIKLDKSVTGLTQLQPPVASVVALGSQFLTYAQETILHDTVLYGSVRRSWDLSDDTDLRIVIQSFQI